jgi:hypothetical protein
MGEEERLKSGLLSGEVEKLKWKTESGVKLETLSAHWYI